MLRKLALAIISISLIGIAACGGGTGLTAQGIPDPQNQTGPDSTLVAKPLPAIPMDAGPAVKGSSAFGDVGNPVVLGKDAMDFSQCLVDGDTLIINPDGIAQSNDDGFPAWALYKMGGLAGLRPLSLNVECQPLGLGKAYYVGIADYTSYTWDWFGPVTIPEFQLDLSENPSQFISNLGNLYFLLVCEGDNSARHYQTTLVTGPGGGGLPGAPFNLEASKGAFPDGVELTWEGGRGADLFEVWRLDPFYADPEGDPDRDPADPGGDGIIPTEWYPIGSTTDHYFFDRDVVPGFPFSYKVRAVNDAGFSAYSNIAEGWSAGGPPPPNYEGIFGFAYGTGDNSDPGLVVPVPGVLIKLVDPGTEELVFAEITDERGFYQFLDIPGGEYLLMAELSGWVFPDVYPVFIAPGMPGQQFDFFGYQDGTEPPPPPAYDGVYGWVFTDDFNDDLIPGVLPGVLITVKAADTRLIIDSRITDEDGFYQFLDLPPGAYLVKAELAGWWIDPPEYYFDLSGSDDPPLEFSFFAYPDQ